MTLKRILQHLATWIGIYSFWLLLTLGNHPTLPIAMAATGIMVVTSAAAVYLYLILLRPRFARERWWSTLGPLVALLAALTLAAVVSIQWVYDAMWGPDPLRFGFWTNMALDATGITLHLVLAALFFRFVRGNQPMLTEVKEE